MAVTTNAGLANESLCAREQQSYEQEGKDTEMGVRAQLCTIFSRGARKCAVAALLIGFVVPGTSFAQDNARKVISRTAPSFPELAKRMHLTGKVRVEVVVNQSGTVTSAKVVGGNPVFETNAVEAVKQWKFEPAATATKGIVILEFTD